MHRILSTVILLMATCGTIVGQNIIKNGDFEDEELSGWHFQEWKGMTIPGFISRENPHSGKQYFILSIPGKMSGRFINSSQVMIDSEKSYILSFALALKDIKPGSINVRVLQYGEKPGKKMAPLGWLSPIGRGQYELVGNISETISWKTYSIKIPASAFNKQTKNLSIYFYHNHPGLGEVMIDNVKLVPAS